MQKTISQKYAKSCLSPAVEKIKAHSKRPRGNYFPRLIFNFTPTNLPSLSKITPAFSKAPRIAGRLARVVSWRSVSKFLIVETPNKLALARSVSVQSNRARAVRDSVGVIDIIESYLLEDCT